MDLLDRYVYDVGRRLPAKQREDIEKELKSLLMDALDARAEGRQATDEDLSAVLKEFGSPADVAVRYTGDRYVVGPGLYHTYRMVLLIVLGAVALGLFVSTFIAVLFQPGSGPNVGALVLQFFGSLVSSVWGAIGIVTVIFWGIERGIIRNGGKLPDGTEEWDPKKLPPVPQGKNHWKPADSIASIVFAIIALILFNAYPDLIAVYNHSAAGAWQKILVISPEALAAFLPLWNIGWALSLALHAMLLAQGRWRLGTNLANIALQGFNIAVAAVMMAGPVLLNSALTISGDAATVESFSTVMSVLRSQFHWVFVLVILGSVIEIGRTIIRMVRERI